MEGARIPKAGQSQQHHTAHLRDAGTWAGGTQDSQDAAVELLLPTSSYTSHQLLQHHRQQAVQTWEVKPRTAAGEGRMQRQESQGLFTSHTAMERTMAREPLFDLRFLKLTENSKLIFSPDLQILRRRRKRNKKKRGHLLKVPAAEERAVHGDSPGRALV